MNNKWFWPTAGVIAGFALIGLLVAVLRLHELCNRYTWAQAVRLICGEPVQVDPTPTPSTALAGCGLPCDEAAGFGCEDGLSCIYHVCLGDRCEQACASSCTEDNQCAAGLACGADPLYPSADTFGWCAGASCEAHRPCNETPDGVCDPTCELERLQANRQTLLCGESGGYRCCTTNLDGRGTGCFLARDPDCDASELSPALDCVSGDGACNPLCAQDRIEANRYALECSVVDGVYQCCLPSSSTGPTCFAAWDNDCVAAALPPSSGGGGANEPTFTPAPGAAACGSPCTSDAQCAGLGPNPACAGGYCYDAQTCGADSGGSTTGGGTDGGSVDCSAVGQKCNLDPAFGACPADYTCGGPYDEFNYGTCQKSGCP